MRKSYNSFYNRQTMTTLIENKENVKLIILEKL